MESFHWQGLWDHSLAATLLVFQLAGFILAARVVLSNRSSHGTIAWSISLVLLPLAAVPMYLLFGRDRLSSYIASKRMVDAEFARQNPHPTLVHSGAAGFKWDVLSKLVSSKGLTDGNAVDLFFNGREAFDSMLQGIDRARDYVLFQFFIFRDDPEGRIFVEKLKKKAQDGIRVYFLVDAIGSRKLKKSFFNELRQSGIHVGVFSPGRSIKGRLRVNFRNHRKVVIIDGQEAWIGGHNIGREYVGKDPRFGPWRDTHAHVRGDVIDAIQLAFLEDWYWVTRAMPELNWKQVPEKPGQIRALCLATGPSDTEETCTLAFVHMINRARKRLWIHSPYFVPSEEVIVALQLATLRGVDVRVLMPSRRDHLFVWISSFYFSSLPQLNNVRFFRYNRGFLHSKMLLLDDELVAMGTVNFDNRSFRINFECTLLLDHPGVVEICDRQMREDFSYATEDPVDPLATKNGAFRLAAHAVRLLAPLL